MINDGVLNSVGPHHNINGMELRWDKIMVLFM